MANVAGCITAVGSSACASSQNMHSRSPGPDAASKPEVSASASTQSSIACLNTGSDAYSRSEEHTSELQSLMRISYAVFCLKKKTHSRSLKTTKYAGNPDIHQLIYTPSEAII